MPDDEKIDEFIGRHAAGYRADAPAPADAMWARIERDVADAVVPARRLEAHRHSANRHAANRRGWLVAGAGLAAALLLGVGIGRWSKPLPTISPPIARVATTHDDSLQRVAQLHAAAYDHLGATDAFLTEVRADLRAGRGDADRAARSRELLARTRLLLQRRDQQSPVVTRLLDDLELLLAEIAALPDSGRTARPADAALLEESLGRDDIIPRIRTAVPTRAAGS